MRTALLFIALVVSLAVHAQSFDELKRTASGCFRQQDYACAAKALKKAIKNHPDHPDVAIAWSDMGTALRRMGKGDDALRAYDEALLLSPTSVSILRNRASLKRNRGDLQGSLADYDKAVAADPTNSESYMERANTKARLRDLEGEEADLMKAVELAPNDHKAAVNLAVMKKRRGRLQECLDDLNAIIAAHPGQPIPWNNRADIILTMHGDLDAAMQDIQEALRLDPQYANGYITRAEIHLEQGNKQLALTDLNRAVALGMERAEFADLFARCE